MLIIVTKVSMSETVIMVTKNIMVDMVIIIVVVMVVMVIRTDRTTRTRDKQDRQDRQILHLNLTFQVTCVGQLSQFLRCFVL